MAINKSYDESTVILEDFALKLTSSYNTSFGSSPLVL